MSSGGDFPLKARWHDPGLGNEPFWAFKGTHQDVFVGAHSISHSLSHQDTVRMFDLQGMPGVSGLAPEVDVVFFLIWWVRFAQVYSSYVVFPGV